MKKIIYIIIAVIVMFTSCTSENSKIKKVLKTSITESLRSEYSYDSHRLLETILKTNLTDSISTFKSDISMIRDLIHIDSFRLNNIRSNIADCKRKRSNALNYFRSTYDRLLDDYDKMETNILEQIEEKNMEIREKEARIDFLDKAMNETDSPIVFYKFLHRYKIRGMYKDSILLVNTKYEIVK